MATLNNSVTPSPGDIAVHNLHKTLGSTQAVNDLSFSIPEGKFLCLLGPSGCGKTTTLRMIAGLLDPDKGDVEIGGESMGRRPAERRPTSIVFQDYALFPHMTTRENIAFGAKKKHGKTKARRIVEELINVVGLESVADRKPGSLSGGQQQRVALARSLAMRPAVILLDEPLSNLDAKVRILLRSELRRIQADFGTTMIYVTHDQEEAMALSDEIVIMQAGKIEQVGVPEEIYRKPATPFVADFIGIGTWFNGVYETDRKGQHYVRLERDYLLPIINPDPIFSPNDLVHVFARPEAINLGLDVSEPGIKSVAISQQFMGSVQRFVLRTDSGTEVIVDVDGHDVTRLPEVGQKVVFTIERDHECVFASEVEK